MNVEPNKRYRAISKNVIFSKKITSTLALIFLLPACTTVIPLKVGTDFLPPSPIQIPLTVGVYHSTDLRNYQYSVEPILGQDVVLPVGMATVGLLDGLYPDLFSKTVPVESRPPPPINAPSLAGVLETSIEAFDVGVGHNLCWAQIVYRFTVHSPSAEGLISWNVRGVGEGFGQTVNARVVADTVALAMRDAAQKLQTSFFDVPEARRWARNLPALNVNAAVDAQTTLREGQLVWSVFPEVAAATAQVDRYAYAPSIMSAKIRVRNDGRRRLFVRPSDFSLELPGGRIDPPAPASAFVIAAAPLFARRVGPWPWIGVGPTPLTLPLWVLLLVLIELPAADELSRAGDALARYTTENMRAVTLWEGNSAEFIVHFTTLPDTATVWTLAVPVIDLDTASRYVIRIPMQ